MISDATIATLALSEDAQVDPRLFALLVLHFGSPVNVFEQLPDRLSELPQLSASRARRIVAAGEKLDLVRLRLEQYAARGIRVVSIADPDYPESLQKILEPPPCLYLRGSLVPSLRRLAVAGAADATAEGIADAVAAGKELARLDLGVVSGLTGGISGGAHLGCLTAGGSSCAVKSSGLDVDLAPEHLALLTHVVSSGSVLSEYPPATRFAPAHEIATDRIILGLSVALVVIEPEIELPRLTAITELSLCEGKPVFVATREPSEATSELLRLGAYPLPSPDDLEALVKFI